MNDIGNCQAEERVRTREVFIHVVLLGSLGILSLMGPNSCGLGKFPLKYEGRRYIPGPESGGVIVGYAFFINLL
jgi:hypothetical protein